MTALISRMEDVVAIRGRDWASLPKREQKQAVRLGFRYWRSRGFPYFELSREQILAEFRRLSSTDPSSAFRDGGVAGSVVGLRLANHFQPHMWKVRVSRYRSPMEVFKDDHLLPKAIERSWRIWPDRFGANPSTLRRMLKTYPGAASVSNFRPTLARAIIDRFSPRGGTVVDFAAGYGGRLVGCLTLDRKYVGIEPSREQVAGLRETFRVLRGIMPAKAKAEIHQGCAEDMMPCLPTQFADLVFSSPPYYDWERYSQEPTQSFVRYPSYNQWLQSFLGCVIREGRRILKKGGKLILNLPRRNRLPTLNDVEQLAFVHGLRRFETLPMLLARVPYLHPRRAGPFKSELLLVFKKS